MKRYQFGGFSRISKAAARKMYDAGRVVWACPVKMRPDGYFSTALQAVARGVCFDKSPYSGRWELTACEWDNRSVPGEPDRFGYCGTHYIKDERLYLANDAIGDSFIDGEGRLCAEKAIAAIEKNREHYQRKVETMREQLSRIDSIISKYKELETAKKEFNDSLDYSIRDYFGLKLD